MRRPRTCHTPYANPPSPETRIGLTTNPTTSLVPYSIAAARALSEARFVRSRFGAGSAPTGPDPFQDGTGDVIRVHAGGVDPHQVRRMTLPEHRQGLVERGTVSTEPVDPFRVAHPLTRVTCSPLADSLEEQQVGRVEPDDPGHRIRPGLTHRLPPFP